MLILNYLANRGDTHARLFWLSKWAFEDPVEATVSIYSEQRNEVNEDVDRSSGKLKGMSSKKVAFSSEETKRLVSHIESSEPFMSSYDNLLKTILTSMSDNNLKHRTRYRMNW